MDIDGDGLKDYACVAKKNGEVNIHRSIPNADGTRGIGWDDLGTVAEGENGRDGSGVMFAE